MTHPNPAATDPSTAATGTARILVTGGAGFIGSYQVRTLLGPEGPAASPSRQL